METFMNENFLLGNETARKLYHDYAKHLPIIDYHCHVDPKEIYQNRKFDNITQVWLGGDHYKWRIMRSNGVDEKYITGDASDRDKFQKFAEALPKAIGNPMYHWCHLELKAYFGFEGNLNGNTAEEVWNLCNEKLQNDDSVTVRGLIKQSNVAMVGTTDDPCDTLEWHEKIANDADITAKVLPSFRPDKALNIEKVDWKEYIERLSGVCGFEIKDIASLEKALESRILHFDKMGCLIADHGLDYVCYREGSTEEINKIFAARMEGKTLSTEEVEIFKTRLLVFCGRQYSKLGWVQQWHYNCLRNPNKAMFEKLGPDTGFDVMNDVSCTEGIANLLNALNITDELPKTIIYSLNSIHNGIIGTMIGAFQGTEIAGKIQHGSGWWFNDTKNGMIEQMTSLASLGLLGNFVGMLTDSRSFLSYTRHEYFRRIVCNLIGGWVENGEYPQDYTILKEIVEGISYYNAFNYFKK